jgi:hypothetical protein
MQEIELGGGNTIALTSNFDDMFDNLRNAHYLKEVMELHTQVYASWIVINKLWATKQEDYWIDPLSGIEYTDKKDAPRASRSRLRYCRDHKYRTQKEFFQKLREEEMPDFKIPTFWRRHAAIMDEVSLWCRAHDTDDIPPQVFAKICENIVFYGNQIVRDMADKYFHIERGKSTGLTVQNVKMDADFGLLDIDPDESEDLDREVAEKVYDILDSAHKEASVRGVRNVTGDIKKKFFKKGYVGADFNDMGRLIITYEPPDYDEDDVSVSIPEKYEIHIYKDGSEVFLSDLPQELANALRVRWTSI